MARLTAAQRKKIPKSKFGVPAKAKTATGKAKPGSFPMNDKKHARAALSFIRYAPPGRKAAIKAKAARMGVGVKKKKK